MPTKSNVKNKKPAAAVKKPSGGLAGKLGNVGKKAFDSHKSDETNYGNMDLPDGIEGGIAQLVDCRFDVYAKGNFEGEYYFYAAAVVVAPEEFKGMKIAGLRTSIMEPMCETPGRSRESVEEHLAHVLNELRKLGADTSEASYEDLEEIAAAIKEQQPYIRFRTWKGEATKEFPNPRTNHQWGGTVEYDPDNPDASTANVVEDNTENTGGDDEGDDLEALANAADNDDDQEAKEAAQVRLTELATAAGIEEEDIAGADSWAAVAELITAANGEGAWEPAKGEECHYKPKGAKKPIKCAITGVLPSKETATLKGSDGKVYKSVPFAELTAIENE